MSQPYKELAIPAYSDPADVPEAFKEFADSMDGWFKKQSGTFSPLTHSHPYAPVAHTHPWTMPDGNKILNNGGFIANDDPSSFLSVSFGLGKGILHEDGSARFTSTHTDRIETDVLNVNKAPGAKNTYGQTLNSLQFRNIIIVTSGQQKPTTGVFQGDIALDSNDNSIYAYDGANKQWFKVIG